MARSPGLAFNALIIATVLAIMSESFALRASMKVVTLVRMIAIEFLRDGSLFPVLMNDGVLFFEVMYDPFSYKVGRDVIGNDGEFRGVSDSVDDAMSNGGSDGGGEDYVEAKDISVLVSKLVF